MKVLFIQPPRKDMYMCTPMLGLGYLMGFLENKNIECYFIDGIKEQLSVEEIANKAKEINPDLICISVMSPFYKNVKLLVKYLKEFGKLTVLGGPHVSALPEESLKDIGADYAIHGEGEYALWELTQKLNESKNKIGGLVYWKDGAVVVNKPRLLIENLDELPMPAWHLMDPKTYPFAPHNNIAREFPVAPILTSRGCPYNCDFCAVNVVWRRVYRMRSIKNVVDEIEYLIKNYGVKEIHFEDDNLTLIRERVVELCNEIKKRNLKFVWACPNGIRIDSLDEPLLKMMAEVGCYSLSFGIESGSQKILDSINKKLDLAKVPDAINMAKKVGIETRGFFIIGFPEDTEDTINQTINFAKSLDLDIAGFFKLIPLPGSAIFNHWVRKNNLRYTDIDWGVMDKTSKYSEISVCNLSEDKITRLYSKAYRSFYLRPHILFHILKNIKLKQMKWMFKRVSFW